MYKNLEKTTVVNLKKICQKEGIPNCTKLKKSKLILLIKKKNIMDIIGKGLKQLDNIG
jgi:hypothetical protein